jgi:CRP-like cAMP-binding protein
MAILDVLRDEHGYQSYAAGQVIFQAGELGDRMYVVKEGEVEVIVNKTVVDTIGPGGVIGEMALIEAKPRSATVVTKTVCQLLPIDEPRFLSLVQQRPQFSLEIMRMLADRLRKMDERIVDECQNQFDND